MAETLRQLGMDRTRARKGAVRPELTPSQIRGLLADVATGGGVPFIDAASQAAQGNYGQAAVSGLLDAPPVKMAGMALAPIVGMVGRSNINDVVKEILKTKGKYGAGRVERAADEIPNLEKMYTQDALVKAFSGDNAKALMTMNPKNFEMYAAPLQTGGLGAFTSQKGQKEYIDELAKVGPFSDVPFLQIDKQEYGLPITPFISGHEGRHRSRALAQKGEQSGLVVLLPRAELREPFPRREQEEYINALMEELKMTGNMVKPEFYNPSVGQEGIARKKIRLPDIYGLGALGLGIPITAGLLNQQGYEQ